MKTVDVAAKRKLSGARQGLVGVGLLILAYPLWLARDAIPDLATTRVIATASFTLWHGASEADLQRAFASVQASSPAEAIVERESKPDIHAYYLHVTADTPARAKADLATLSDAVTAAFPSAERNLTVSPNNSTVAAPNGASRRISVAVHAALLVLMLSGQFLIVVGAWREGQGRTGVLVALAMPFTLLIFPSTGTSRASNMHDTLYSADWHFVLLLLALTPLAAILGLWLTRRRT